MGLWGNSKLIPVEREYTSKKSRIKRIVNQWHRFKSTTGLNSNRLKSISK